MQISDGTFQRIFNSSSLPKAKLDVVLSVGDVAKCVRDYLSTHESISDLEIYSIVESFLFPRLRQRELSNFKEIYKESTEENHIKSGLQIRINCAIQQEFFLALYMVLAMLGLKIIKNSA